MENKQLRNIFVAALMAVFAGVLTLGVNAAFGVESPSLNPADSALVNPTFGGVNLGSIKNKETGGILNIDSSGGVDINGPIRNSTSSGVPVTFNDGEGVKINSGNLDIQAGEIFSGASGVTGNFVKINDGLKIGGQFSTISGSGLIDIVNGIKILAGGVTIDAGGLKVTGGIQNPGAALGITDPDGVDFNGPIFSTSTNTGKMPRVNDTDGFDVWGPIQNANPNTGSGTSQVKYPVEIKDADGVKIALGVLDIWDSVKNSKPDTGSGNSLVQYGVKIADILEVTGVIRNPDNTSDGEASTLDGAVGIDDHFKVGDDQNKKLAWFYGDLDVKATKNCVAGQDCGGVSATTNGSLNVEGSATVSKNVNAQKVTTTDSVTVGGNLYLDNGTLCLSKNSDGSCGSFIKQPEGYPMIITAEDGSGNAAGSDLKLMSGSSNTTDNSNTEAYMLLRTATTFSNGQVISALTNPKVEIGKFDNNTDLYVNGNTTNTGTLTVNGNTTNTGTLTVTGKTNANGGLSVTGKVTSTDGFGTYTRRLGPFLAVPKTSYAEASSPCNEDEIIVSCGGQASDTNTDINIAGGLVSSENYAATGWVSFTNLDAYPVTNTCYARGSNKGNIEKYVRAIAMCFNSAQ